MNKFLRPLVCLSALICAATAAQSQIAQEARDAGLYAPSIWELNIGAHASELPRDEYINYACGTNGGPPSLVLADWRQFARCTPEAAGGLREVYFRYDDEPEYWAKARSMSTQAALFEYTSAYEIPVIASALFDANGFLTGIRMVTDPRVPVEKREKGSALANFLMARYGDDGWTCVDLPAAPGETQYRGLHLKQRCDKADAIDGVRLSLDVHNYRKAGQYLIDPLTNLPTEGQFESTTRFELTLLSAVADGARRLAALGDQADTAGNERRDLVAKARDCPGCDLRGANLKRADLSGANLAGANLAGANFHGTTLSSANLAGANLEGANLNRADLKRSNFQMANMKGAMLYEARLDAANLSGANLTQALAGKVQLIGATLTNTRMWAMDLRNARMNDATFVGADFREAWLHDSQMTRSDFSGANFDSALLWGVNLVQAKLRGADMRSADLIRANLREADLTNADFGYSRLTFANMQDTIVTGARWNEADLPAGFTPN